MTITWRNVSDPNGSNAAIAGKLYDNAGDNFSSGINAIGSAIKGFDASQTNRIDTGLDQDLDSQVTALRQNQQNAIANLSKDLDTFSNSDVVADFNRANSTPVYETEKQGVSRILAANPTMDTPTAKDTFRTQLEIAKNDYSRISAKDYGLSSQDDLENKINQLQNNFNSQKVVKSKSSDLADRAKTIAAEASAQSEGKVDDTYYEAENAYLDEALRVGQNKIEDELTALNRQYKNSEAGAWNGINQKYMQEGVTGMDMFSEMSRELYEDEEGSKDFFNKNKEQAQKVIAMAEEGYSLLKSTSKAGELPENIPPALLKQVMDNQIVTDTYLGYGTAEIENSGTGSGDLTDISRIPATPLGIATGLNLKMFELFKNKGKLTKNDINKAADVLNLNGEAKTNYLSLMSEGDKSQQRVLSTLALNLGKVDSFLAQEKANTNAAVNINSKLMKAYQISNSKKLALSRQKAADKQQLNLSAFIPK